MATALAALGSNEGDRAATLDQAVLQLRQHPEIEVQAVSTWHQTEPVGGPAGQDVFLNGAVLLETSLAPLDLLHAFQAIEQAAWRQRQVHWGPRTLDLDLLLYDQQVMHSAELTVPHPRMAFRRFVIEPAAEIAPQMVHPQLGWSLLKIKEHLDTAPNYLALFGPPGFAPKKLATEVANELSGTLLLDQPIPRVKREPPFEKPKELLDCLKTLLHHLYLLGAAAQKSDKQEDNRLLVSDFWLGEALVAAETLCLPDAEAVRVAEKQYRSKLLLLSPKLIVCVFPSEKQIAETSQPDEEYPAGWKAAEVTCRISVPREQLQQWRDHAQRLLSSGDYGPWLLLDGVDQETAFREVHAAALAMQ